jgi:hypothetical protein
MKPGTLARVALATAGLTMIAATAASAETANPHIPLQKTIGQTSTSAPVPSLFVINAEAASLAGGKLTLNGVATNMIVFADRPVRAAGHETTEAFVSRWGDGKDSFKNDPPNATVSVLGGSKDGVTDAVVVLMNPTFEGGTLTFDVNVLEGDLKGLKGPAAVFIDRGGGFGGGGGMHGGDHGGWAAAGDGWHGQHGWYGWHGGDVAAGVAAGAVAGAAVGAAVAHPYYHRYYYDGGDGNQPCGYGPYPPCY